MSYEIHIVLLKELIVSTFLSDIKYSYKCCIIKCQDRLRDFDVHL